MMLDAPLGSLSRTIETAPPLDLRRHHEQAARGPVAGRPPVCLHATSRNPPDRPPQTRSSRRMRWSL